MPEDYDLDLKSIQEARRLLISCREAQRQFAFASQETVDRICKAMAEAAFGAAARLGQLASEETGYGVAAHKRVKNEFASRNVWESIKDIKTVGVIGRDERRKVVDIAWPVGVIAALTPSTNPTSTAIFKILIAVKGRNGIIIGPHPSAKACSVETARVMAEAGEAAGMPKGLVGCMSHVTLQGSQELISHWATSLILATGGPGMVKAAHSVGKPAIGVGPGNVPAYVDRSADVKKAAWDIVNSKAFDSSVICATEQAVVADKPIAAELRAEMVKNGAYWLNAEQKAAIERTLFGPDGGINARSVGKTPQQLARMAGISVPKSARILVADLDAVGKEQPLSREKLTTVLGFYVEDGWRAGCERCIQLIKFGGDGHTLVIHARDEEVILAFGLEKPVFRIVVNTWGTMGAIGATTGVMPSMTLAPGGVGGAVVSDNITVHHTFNIKRLAYEIGRPPDLALTLAPDVEGAAAAVVPPTAPAPAASLDSDAIETIVRRVLAEIGRR
ncbi:MAG: aldehyde dehydrogenase family protein [Caldilineales bacterium]|nr:aldehyde dehydrogenase family protein [Caldilineales bacterium]